MTYQEISTIEHAARSAMAWSPEAQDGQRNFRLFAYVAIPVGVVLLAAATVMGRLMLA